MLAQFWNLTLFIGMLFSSPESPKKNLRFDFAYFIHLLLEDLIRIFLGPKYQRGVYLRKSHIFSDFWDLALGLALLHDEELE